MQSASKLLLGRRFLFQEDTDPKHKGTQEMPKTTVLMS